jgi:hypothetical protein
MISESELDTRIDDLCGNLSSYNKLAIGAYRLDSPVCHFHIKTIKRLKSHKDFKSVFEDEVFFDYLYATLVAWNMDSQRAKLCGFEQFIKTIRNSRQQIVELNKHSLKSLIHEDAEASGRFAQVVERINTVLSSLRVSGTKSWLVANTKALHHVLPELIPPVDRKYTLKFFFDSTSVKKDEKSNNQFFEVLVQYLYIYNLVADEVENMVDENSFNSSSTKVIDNAIIGYWIDHKSRLSQTTGDTNVS